MENLVTIKEKINQMADLVLSMLKTTFKGFMEHDSEILDRVLKDEQRLNEIENNLTLSLIGISKNKVTDSDKKNIMHLSNIVADLEQIGDYIKDMIERIEIKIEEKLLFSDEALSEYRNLYGIIETAFSDIVNSLITNDKNLAKQILKDKGEIDILVNKYRDAHTERLLSGICDPRAGNMFLNLLDFTGQIFNHTKSIAKNILELK